MGQLRTLRAAGGARCVEDRSVSVRVDRNVGQRSVTRDELRPRHGVPSHDAFSRFAANAHHDPVAQFTRLRRKTFEPLSVDDDDLRILYLIIIVLLKKYVYIYLYCYTHDYK